MKRVHPGVELRQALGDIRRYKEHLDDIWCDILDAGFPKGEVDDSDSELAARNLVRALLQDWARLKREREET